MGFASITPIVPFYNAANSNAHYAGMGTTWWWGYSRMTN